MTWSSSMGGGLWPNTISQLKSSKLGFMVSGMPSSSVKKVCTGALHKLTHMPAHLLSARYLHNNRWQHLHPRHQFLSSAIQHISMLMQQAHRTLIKMTVALQLLEIVPLHQSPSMRAFLLGTAWRCEWHPNKRTPASFYVDATALCGAIAKSGLHSLHGPHKPGEEGWRNASVELCTPLGVWECPPETGRHLREASYYCLPLLLRAAALYPNKSMHKHQLRSGICV